MKDIMCPILIIHGKNDSAITIDKARALSKKAPNFEMPVTFYDHVSPTTNNLSSSSFFKIKLTVIWFKYISNIADDFQI